MNQPNNKRVDSVVKNTTKVERKKGLVGFLFPSSLQDVGRTYINEVMVPGIRKLCFDSIVNIASNLFLGSSSSSNYKSGTTYGSPTKGYSSYYDRPAPTKNEVLTVEDIDTVRFSDRYDATSVLNGLQDLMNSWGVVSVSDYYDLAGIVQPLKNYNNNNYGWSNQDFSNCKIVLADNQTYRLVLPKPIYIG